MGRTTSFRGSFTALVTPFQNGTVDEKAFRALVTRTGRLTQVVVEAGLKMKRPRRLSTTTRQ